MQFPSLHSLAAAGYLAHIISGDASPDGRVRRQALALLNRNAYLLDCSTYLTLAMVDVALRRTGCEYEATAQNALVIFMTYSIGDSAPGLKLRLEALVKNTLHHACLNDLALHMLSSRPTSLFCDFFYAMCQLGYVVPPAFQRDIAPILRHAMTTARRDSVIQQAALCYLELIGADKCIAAVVDSLLSAQCSSESNAVAVALASLDCDKKLLLKYHTDHASAQPMFMFSVDLVAYLNALPTFFHSLPSAAFRGLSLQIVDQRADTLIAPFVLKCLFSLPCFLLKGFVFKMWLQIVQRMQCVTTLLRPVGGSSSAFEVSFGDEGVSAAVIDFRHRTGAAAMLLPLILQRESGCSTFVFEFISKFSDFSGDGLFLLQHVLSHLAQRCDAAPHFTALACILVNLCILNHNDIEEIIEVIKRCQSIWSHVLRHLELSQKEGTEFHPACQRLANVLLSCIAARESLSMKRGKFSSENCNLFVFWGKYLASYDLIVSLWLDAAAFECFIFSCDRITCSSVLRAFFSGASHADSLRSIAKKFKSVAAKVSESACCTRFTSCCIESLLHVIGTCVEGQSGGAHTSSIVDSAMTFLNILISQRLPMFENSSHSFLILEFILLGVQSSESSLGALSGLALTSLFRHPVADSLRPCIEAVISDSVSQVFGLFRQREYTSAARVVAAGLVSTGSRLSGFTSKKLFHESCLRSGHAPLANSEQPSCSDIFSSIRLILGPSSFSSCGSLCMLRFIESWDEISLDFVMDCVSMTLMNSHQHLIQVECDVSDSSGDDDPDDDFAGKLHAFEVRKMFRTIYEGLLLFSECLKRCPFDSIKISPEWLQQIYVNVMGLCCNVDHVGATETAAAILLQIFEIQIVHLKATSRMLLLRTLSATFVTLSLEDPELIQYLESVGQGIALPEKSTESYGWRRSSHVCLPIVSSLKALVSSHQLNLHDGTDLFDAFVSAVIVRAKMDPTSNPGVDCLNLLYHITNDHVMTARVNSRRSEILAVCLAAFSSNSFNCQSAACLVISNLATKLYGVLFARKREYEVRASSLTRSDWVSFTCLSIHCAPGALIALFTIFSMIRASDDELISLEPVERCRNLALAGCRSPIAKVRFSASRALPRLVAPSAITALINHLGLEIEVASRNRHWNHMHGLTLAVDSLQEFLRAE